MIPEEELERRVKYARLMAFLFLVLFPAVYLVIAGLYKLERFSPEDSYRFVIYMLLIVAFVTPPLSLVVQRFQVSNYRRSRGKSEQPGPLARTTRDTNMAPGQFYFSSLIVQLAFVEAVYVYGLIAYFISGTIISMLYFYIIGAVWSIVFWPRRDKIITFIKSLEEV